MLTLHDHHTTQLPLYAEPFTSASQNGGKMYLTSKARHYTLIEIGIPVALGNALTIQYKRGSLPPSFEFVNHQVTLGFNLLLAKN